MCIFCWKQTLFLFLYLILFLSYSVSPSWRVSANLEQFSCTLAWFLVSTKLGWKELLLLTTYLHLRCQLQLLKYFLLTMSIVAIDQGKENSVEIKRHLNWKLRMLKFPSKSKIALLFQVHLKCLQSAEAWKEPVAYPGGVLGGLSTPSGSKNCIVISYIC